MGDSEEYVFSIAGFQRKLDSHYNKGARPPLLEARGLEHLVPPLPQLSATVPAFRRRSS